MKCQEPSEHYFVGFVQLIEEAIMQIKILLAAAMLVGVATPVFAQIDWYVVRGPDHRC